jgi:hypothetical protein
VVVEEKETEEEEEAEKALDEGERSAGGKRERE